MKLLSRIAALSAEPLPPSVRARLWCAANELGERDTNPRLWLHLTDGRVLAFRLPHATLGDDRVLGPLATSIADDPRGMKNHFDLPDVGFVQILYAAPVLPMPQPESQHETRSDSWRGLTLTRRDILGFARELDLDVLDFLGTLGRNDFYASVRNYNRLVTQPAESRLRQLQALQRFPGLVAPILLTAHRYPNLFDGQRHAWRQPDPAVEATIRDGRDLAGALAHHYGISKGLVRAPLNAAMWEIDYLLRRPWLAFFDALPDNRRPATTAALEQHANVLHAYLRLLGIDGDTRVQRPLQIAAHVRAFRSGWTHTWESCEKRFGPLTPALADINDFLAAAGRRAMALQAAQRAPSPPRFAAAWIAAHGLDGLLAASARWHRLRPPVEHIPAHFALPSVLGDRQEGGRQAYELLTPAALAEEGASMHHCVGDYWDKCVAGDRIFALRLADGARATAQYTPHDAGGNDVRYILAQLRGPSNSAASDALQVWANHIAGQLNATERFDARRAALFAYRELEIAQRNVCRTAAWLDETSERQLRQVLTRTAPDATYTKLAA